MNKQLFLQQVDKEDFMKVVQYLHNAYDETDYKKSRVLREQLVADVFGTDKMDEDFAKKRYVLELIARASKTDWGQEMYEEATGEKGFVQATAINKKSYYEAVVGKELTKYNPRMYEDILRLVDRAVPEILANPHSSAEEISSRMCRQYGYVVGSILPSVGTIRAHFNRQVNLMVERISDGIQKEKQLIFNGNRRQFLDLMGCIFDESVIKHSNEEIAQIVAEKLHSKN